jgi:hypothetical protein
MESATKMFIRARESVVRNILGQTMTEYTLVLLAVAGRPSAPILR